MPTAQTLLPLLNLNYATYDTYVISLESSLIEGPHRCRQKIYPSRSRPKFARRSIGPPNVANAVAPRSYARRYSCISSCMELRPRSPPQTSAKQYLRGSALTSVEHSYRSKIRNL